MATISLCIRESQRNSDGSYTIKLAIGAMSRTTYLATPYKVASLGQWKNGRVVKHPEAAAINKNLQALLRRGMEILDEVSGSSMTAPMLRKYVEAKLSNSELFLEYATKYIDSRKNELSSSAVGQYNQTVHHFREKFGESMTFKQITPVVLHQFEQFMRGKGLSVTTLSIYMGKLKAILNAAVDHGVAEYKVFPFKSYKMPSATVRDIHISKEEFTRLREVTFPPNSRKERARDIFMLSFYLGGMNLVDMLAADFSGQEITYVRKKTEKKNHNKVTISVQPEARAIINKYVRPDGTLDFGIQSRNALFIMLSRNLRSIGKELGFGKTLMFYSARKTFVQFGVNLGIPLHILQYVVGHAAGGASRDAIYNYFFTMQKQGDMAIRTIINYAMTVDEETDAEIIPAWAQKYYKPGSE